MPIQRSPQRLSIRQIQGASHRSAHEGKSVTTRGVITGFKKDGFWIQEEKSGKASSAVFVHAPDHVGKTKVGDEVSLTGTVTEYEGRRSPKHSLTETQVAKVTNLVVLARNQKLPSAMTLPSVSTPEEMKDLFERYEGMRVEVGALQATGPVNRYGDVHGTRGEGMPLEVVTRGASFDGEIKQGSLLEGVSGNLTYRAGLFQIQAQSIDNISGGTALAKEETTLIGDARHLTVASFNLENVDGKYETRRTYGMRSDDDVGSGKMLRLAEDIVKGLKSPDIIGVQEVQDDNGVEHSDVTSASKTAALLISHIKAMGGPHYEYVERAPVNNAEGGQPGGNIRVGFLYQSKRVALDTTSVQRHGDAEAFKRTRRSLSASFVFKGEEGERRVHIFNNHFSSKSGSSAQVGTQPQHDPAAKVREAQAISVAERAEEISKETPEDLVISLGDFNDFENSATTGAFEKLGFSHFAEGLEKDDRFSHAYRGHKGLLDHIFVKGKTQIEGDIVHRNVGQRRGSSDHDPILVRLKMFGE